MHAVEIQPRSPQAPAFVQLPPLSLYVHLPWCVRKCPYCDFNSHEQRGDIPQQDYVDVLLQDLEQTLPQVWGRPVQTVFLGGGTPSLFEPAQIDRLLAGVRARIRLAPDAEVTMEANPGTFEAQRFRGFREAGVNRLSLGVQSFDAAKLAALGRIHDADQARAAAACAAELFDTFNLDLMYALPRQTLQELDADLSQALVFAPPHLSVYHLTLEEGTRFALRPPPLPDEDAAAAMQDRIEDRLAAAGYCHYEVSAYARPGHRARHNLNYWSFGDYLGIGAGAHAKLSFPGRVRREMRLRQPGAYMQGVRAGSAVHEAREVGPDDLPFEFMLNALRLVDGVPLSLFAERTGLSAATVSRELAQAAERGLLDPDPTVIRPTLLGRRFLNDLQAMFLRGA